MDPGEDMDKMQGAFKMGDNNMDGRLDMSEFFNLMQMMEGSESGPNGGPNKKALEMAFDMSDNDKDGRLSRDEFMGMMQMSATPPVQEMIDMAWGMYDRNGDNFIDMGEYMDVAM